MKLVWEFPVCMIPYLFPTLYDIILSRWASLNSKCTLPYPSDVILHKAKHTTVPHQKDNLQPPSFLYRIYTLRERSSRVFFIWDNHYCLKHSNETVGGGFVLSGVGSAWPMLERRRLKNWLVGRGGLAWSGPHRSCLKRGRSGFENKWMWTQPIPCHSSCANFLLHPFIHSTDVLTSAREISVPNHHDASWLTVGTSKCPYRRADKMPGRIRRERNWTTFRLGKWKKWNGHE